MNEPTRILIAAPDSTTRAIIRHALTTTKDNYLFSEVMGVDTAIEVLREDTIDVILIDLGTLDATIRLCRAAEQARSKPVRVVILPHDEITAHLEEFAQAYEVEFYRYLPKPWEAGELSTYVRMAASRRRQNALAAGR